MNLMFHKKHISSLTSITAKKSVFLTLKMNNPSIDIALKHLG
jgi:hypothetical protein